MMFAISLVAFASAALFLLYSNALQLIQNQQSTQAATLSLQERLEQLRASNWDDLTSSASLLTLLGTPTSPAASLPGLVEDVTVSAYPAPASPKPLHVRYTAGAGTVVAQNTALLSSPSLRVDVRVTWSGVGRKHLRENSVILSAGGTVR